MKKFTDIRTLKEDYGVPAYRSGPLGTENNADTIDIASFDITNPKVVEKLNAYIGSAAARPVIDPQYVLKEIQKKLSIVGLQFSMPNNPTRTSELPKEFDLTYLGGRYGVLDQNYTIGKDDNISHRLGKGLKLKVDYLTQSTGMTIVVPKIE